MIKVQNYKVNKMISISGFFPQMAMEKLTLGFQHLKYLFTSTSAAKNYCVLFYVNRPISIANCLLLTSFTNDKQEILPMMQTQHIFWSIMSSV